MSKLRIAVTLFVIIFLSLIITATTQTIQTYKLVNKNKTCDEVMVREKIISSKKIDSLTVAPDQQYLVECNGYQFRIQSDKPFPINSKIKRSWKGSN